MSEWAAKILQQVSTLMILLQKHFSLKGYGEEARLCMGISSELKKLEKKLSKRIKDLS